METTNTNVSTKRFTFNNFKQELKELAQLQHDEKLFFKHPERYPNFIEEHKEALIKEFQKFHELDSLSNSIPWRLRDRLDNLYYQASESQSQCNERRMHLSSMYKDYYALKHWKKLNMDDDTALIDYFYKGYKPELINKKTYIDNSPEGKKVYDELKKMRYDKLLSTSEYYDKVDKLKRISLTEYKRNELLNYTDKGE